MKGIEVIKTIAILIVIVALFGLAMFGLNFLTGPIIDNNKTNTEHGHHSASLGFDSIEGVDSFAFVSAEGDMI